MSDGVRHVLLVFFGAILGGAIGVAILVLGITKGGSRKPNESAWEFYERGESILGLVIAIPLAIVFFVVKALW
jgi:hypothetical protein